MAGIAQHRSAIQRAALGRVGILASCRTAELCWRAINLDLYVLCTIEWCDRYWTWHVALCSWWSSCDTRVKASCLELTIAIARTNENRVASSAFSRARRHFHGFAAFVNIGLPREVRSWRRRQSTCLLKLLFNSNATWPARCLGLHQGGQCRGDSSPFERGSSHATGAARICRAVTPSQVSL